MTRRMTRREFVGTAAALTGGAVVSAYAETDRQPLLPQRVLGQTKVKVSLLGLGGVGFLTDFEDKEEIAALIHEIMDAGVNYFDTAPAYGKSEESLGLVMSTPRRRDVFLATKTGNRTYDGALKEVETSLKRLGTDTLDLIQIHGFGTNEDDDVAAIGRADGVVPALLKLRDEKVVRFVGITGHPESPKLKEAVATYDFATLLCWVNPRAECRWVENELIPLALEKKMGIIGMKAFGGGAPAGLVGEEPGKAPAAPLLRFALSQPIAAVVPAVPSQVLIRPSYLPLPVQGRKGLFLKPHYQ